MRYEAGTVRVEGGSPYVIGTGTSWLTKADAGQFFWVAGMRRAYIIASVISDTELALSEAFDAKPGNVILNLKYVIGTQFTPNLSMPFPGPHDRDAQSLINRALKILDKVIPSH